MSPESPQTYQDPQSLQIRVPLHVLFYFWGPLCSLLTNLRWKNDLLFFTFLLVAVSLAFVKIVFLQQIQLKGRELRLKGQNRIANLLVPNKHYCDFEDFLTPILDQMLREQKEKVEKLVFCCILINSSHNSMISAVGGDMEPIKNHRQAWKRNRQSRVSFARRAT